MYEFYVGDVLLPVAPENFSWKIQNQNKTMTTISEGEINFLREPGLTEFEFDALIPAVPYTFAKYENGFQSPETFTDHFERLKLSKKPFRFVVVRRMPDGKLMFGNDITVSLESYTVKEASNQGFDLLITPKLKQYRSFGTKIVTVVDHTANVTEQRETENSPEPKQETTYTVKAGDCLWNIAKAFYGDGSQYHKIYEANKDKITKPNLIYPGQVLVIPKG